MGRETKILLGFLGLLAGVFLGVLSMKLLVPRPPAGTGPDIRADVATTTAQERVEPPTPSPVGWDFAAAPPLVPNEPTSEPVAVEPPADRPSASPRFSGFAPPPTEPADVPAPAADDTANWSGPPADERPRSEEPDGLPRQDPFVTPATAVVAAPVTGDYRVAPGDSWWDVAERAYGDGRLYRALFAWNRARDPRISLAPGTLLDVPPLARLQAAWPRLTSPSAPH